jgi:thiosulfate dehydrogenase
MTTYTAARITLIAVITASVGCAEKGSAEEHGAALFQDPTITGSDFNSFACATCHATARPAPGAGLLPGAPLAGATRRSSFWGGSELDLLPSINHCTYYFMLADAPWTAEDANARAIYAYLDSLPSGPEDEAPVPFTVVVKVEDLPPGEPSRGKDIYRRACETCHGEAHTGAARLTTRAPILPDQTLSDHPLGQYTAEERRLVFTEKTRHGGFLGYGGQMPPFSLEVLPDKDLSDLLSFFGLDP